MKKVLLAILLVGSSVATCLAQKSSETSKFSIGLEAGIPTGSFGDFYSVAIGGSLKYDINIAAGTSFNISAGYTSFSGKNGVGSAGFIPVKVGIKNYFSEGFYGEAQVGAAKNTQSGGGTAFAYAPGIGYTFDGGFDIGLRYEAWSKNGTISQFATRIAYSF
jgi:hypothetical protein